MIVFINCDRIPAVEEDLVWQSKGISVYGQEPYEQFELGEGRVLLLWGAIYAVSLSNGTLMPTSLSINGRETVRNLFSNFPLQEAIDQMEGNFIGLLVKHNHEAILFGDTFNRKELFYTRKGGGVVASTGLKAVIQAADKIHYSQNVLVNLLTVYGYYAPKKHTIYENICRLGVGERLHITAQGVSLEKKPFQPLRTRPYGLREHHEYAELMQSAVKIRASSRCNWVFMSSGFDSSTILAILVNQYGPEKVRCLIGRMKYSERSGVINQYELDRAAKIAEYFGVHTDQVDFDLTGEECIDLWKEIAPRLRDQHLYAHSSYNFYRLAGFVAKNGDKEDAVFVGSISDGAHNLGFAQFATILEHPDLGFREYSDKMASYLFGPSFFRRVLEGKIEDDFVYQMMKQRAGNVEFYDAKEMNEYERKIKYLASFFHRNRRIPFFGLHNSSLVTPDGAEAFEKEMTEVYLKEVAEKLAPETIYSCLLYLYNSYYWQGSTERSMVAGVLDLMGKTITSPYWDGRLQRFLSQMPENWGRGLELRPTKYPLKWMLQNGLDYPLHLQIGPHSYLYDVNPQFSHTSEFLFGSALKFYLQERVRNHPYEKVLQPSHFNLNYIHSIVDEYVAGKEFGGSKMNDLLSIVNLCLVGWY